MVLFCRPLFNMPWKMFRQSYRRLLSSLVAVMLLAPLAVALPTSYYTDNSLLSSGKWVKIKVSSTGMQEIPFSQLKQLGFSDPSKVAVYGYSGVELSSYEFSTSMPDDLPAVPVASYGDKLVFYGVATEEPQEFVGNLSTRFKVQLNRNLNNACAYYFLTDSHPRLEVESVDTPVSATSSVLEKAHGLVWRNFTDRQPYSLGAYLFGENIADSGTATYDVHMPAYDPTSKDIPTLTYGLGIKAQSGRLEFSMPGDDGVIRQTSSVQGYGDDPGHFVYRYAANQAYFSGLAKTADDIYPLTVDPSKSVAPLLEASMDYYAFSYPRTTDVSDLSQHRLSFTMITTGQPVKLVNATGSTKAWVVTPGSVPTELVVKEIDADGSLGFVSDRRTQMSTSRAGVQAIVFDPSRELCRVEVVGEVANQNYHGMDVPQMLVVASAKTYDQALLLAEMHRQKTGVEVAVVPFLDICNEFGSGHPHPMAIRRLAKMLYDRDPEKFEALLIFGRAFNDNTGLTAVESPEEFARTYIPMLECDDTSGCGEQPKSYATDAIYGMLSDKFKYDYAVEENHLLRSKLDIKVGRIPAINWGEAADYLVKANRYLDTLSDRPVYNRAIMTADMGDENLHFNQAKDMRDLIAKISPSTMLDMHIQALYNPSGGSNNSMRTRIRQQLQRGVGMWFFLGHSLGCTQIGSGMLWSNAYDKEVYNENPPFAVYGTCQTMVLDSPAPSLQVDMLFNPNGGMIAGVGSTRPVYAQYNVHVCTMMARGYYSQKPGATFGDVYRDGHNLYISSPGTIYPGLTAGHTGIAVNTMCYNFAGDPMLPMRSVPDNKVEILSFNSQEVDGSAIEANPLEKQRIEGVVTAADGSVDTSFSGVLTLTVYDGAHTVTSASTANAENPVMSIDLEEDMLQEVKMTVEDGRFSGEFAFAVPAYSGKGNRMNLYAITDDLSRSAVGHLDGLSVGQSVPDGVVVEAPVISSMYAADEDNSANACLPGDFVLYASVESDEIGLLGSSDRMGGSVSLILDNSKKLAGVDGYLDVAADGSARLAYPVTGIADGPHSLTLRVVNIGGMSAEKTINVNVVNVAEAAIVVDTPLARSQAVIDLDHQLPDAPEGRLVVEDAAGRTVFSCENVSFPYSWNLVDNDGRQVEDGAYTARVYFKAGRRYGSASPATIVVGR